jgi:hypothetical protein
MSSQRKTAIVTGASQGIGAGIVNAFVVEYLVGGGTISEVEFGRSQSRGMQGERVRCGVPGWGRNNL